MTIEVREEEYEKRDTFVSNQRGPSEPTERSGENPKRRSLSCAARNQIPSGT